MIAHALEAIKVSSAQSLKKKVDILSLIKAFAIQVIW